MAYWRRCGPRGAKAARKEIQPATQQTSGGESNTRPRCAGREVRKRRMPGRKSGSRGDGRSFPLAHPSRNRRMNHRPENDGEDHDGSDNDPDRVAARVAGLRVAQRVTNRGSALRHAVYRAVNRSRIDDLPQDIGREPDERADHGAKIKLVHVVLVVEQLVDAFRSAARNLLAVHLPRYNEPCESRSDGYA